MLARSLRVNLLVAPLALFLLLLFIMPLVIMFVYSFWRIQGYHMVPDFTIDNYVEVFADNFYRSLLIRSLIIGFFAGLLCVLIAYPLAYLLAFRARKYRDLLLFLIMLTLFGNYLVRIYAWRSVLSANGLVDVVLIWLGVSRENQSYLLFTPAGTLVTLVNVYLPIAILPIYSALLNVPPSVVAAARDLGASSWRAFWKVTLPLSAPGVLVSFAFMFFISTGDFVTPDLVGGTGGSMIGGIIVRQFSEDFNWPQGAATAFATIALMAIVVVASFALARIVGLRSRVST